MKYIEISNVNSRGIISEKAIEEIEFASAPSRARRKVAYGDTIISSVRPNLQAIAYIEIDEPNLVCSTGFYVVVPTQPYLINQRFLYFCLLSENSKQYFESVAKGVGYPAVDDKEFKAINLALPALAEQQAIARYLDQRCGKLDAIIAIKLQQIKTLDALRQSIIYQAVTKGLDASAQLVDSGVEWLGKIPKGWRVSKLKYITDQIVDGTHFTPNYVESGVPFLRVTDIQTDSINLDRVKFITQDEHAELTKRAAPKKGDILLSKNGTIGITKVVDWDWEFSIFVSLCLIKLLPSINPYYFSYFFESDVVNQQLFESSKKTSVTNLHLVKIRELLMCFPSLVEQQRIINHLNIETKRLDQLKSNLNQQIATLESLKKSLIYECVTGKKRFALEHPSDEIALA